MTNNITCRSCGRTMKPSRHSTIDAETTHQGGGLCTRDYARDRRGHQLPKAPEPPLTPATTGRDADILNSLLNARRRRGIPTEGLKVAS